MPKITNWELYSRSIKDLTPLTEKEAQKLGQDFLKAFPELAKYIKGIKK